MSFKVPLRLSGLHLRNAVHHLHAPLSRQRVLRSFNSSRRVEIVKPFLLADIGEGITECQIIQWFVQPGARVEQFDKICEVQSDKASVEITSRFDGIIKKLHYEKDDVAKVGKPLLDIDIQSELSPEDEAVTTPPEEQGKKEAEKAPRSKDAPKEEAEPNKPQVRAPVGEQEESVNSSGHGHNGKAATLATPAVRRITKELGVDIADVSGSGKDGRVLKEDVQKFADGKEEQGKAISNQGNSVLEVLEKDKTVQLTAMQSAMYKTMTRSLSIPHFLYTDTVDFTSLNTLRQQLNKRNAKSGSSKPNERPNKLSALAFIVKAVSLAFQQHPHLNAHLNASTEKPTFTLKAAHNVGIAVDSPSGLVVPVIKDVQNHTIASLAAEISRLSSSAQAGKLSNADLQGATFTVTNVGSIGGTAVAPVIVSPQVAIVGIGRARAVPAFAEDGSIVRKDECVFSWSADHRVLDGATVARAADTVRQYLENAEDMLVRLR